MATYGEGAAWDAAITAFMQKHQREPNDLDKAVLAQDVRHREILARLARIEDKIDMLQPARNQTEKRS